MTLTRQDLMSLEQYSTARKDFRAMVLEHKRKRTVAFGPTATWTFEDKLTMQYPGLLKKLDLDLRRYFLGEAKGSLYRVFAGPFESLGDAQKACEDIRTRFGDQFCRPVLN